MSRKRNIKIDFTGTSYTPASRFTLGADGGVTSVGGITYNQLTSTGPGYDFYINDATSIVSVTASIGPCAGTKVSESFSAYPTPITSPIRLSSTNRNDPFDLDTNEPYSMAYVNSGSCDDIYVVTNVVQRIHNNTGEVFTDAGIFEGQTTLGSESDIIYIPEYDCIAVGNNNVGVYPPGASCLNIVSMSGDVLFEVDINATHYPTSVGKFTYHSGDKYLYADSAVYLSGSTNVGGIRSGMVRVDLDTMQLDLSWSLDVGTSNGGFEPVDAYVVFSGSDDVIQVDNDKIRYVTTTGYDWEVDTDRWFPALNRFEDGQLSDMIQLKDGSIMITGNFARARRKAPADISYGPWYYQSHIMRVDTDLDWSPYTSSFSSYSDYRNPPIRFANFGGNVTNPKLLELPDVDNVIVYTGANSSRIFSQDISGSYSSTSGSIGYIDYTGSMIPFNYPSSAPSNAGIRFMRVQSDSSYYGFLHTTTNPQYDGKEVGQLLMISQSGVVTDYL